MLKKTREDIIINVSGYIFIIVFSALCLIPFALIIAGSFTDETTLIKYGYSLFPRKTSLLAYRLIFMDDSIFDAYKVTIIVTILGTFCSLVFTCAMAYALSVNSFKPRNKIAFFVYFTMLFSGGLVPSYLLISKYLNLKNTLWVYIIPGLINPYNMFLMRNFFKTIPESLSESAKIDGANDVYILFKIVLPLSKPALATIGLFYALGYWNEWFTCVLYITDNKLISLQYLIMNVLREIDFMKELGKLQQTLAIQLEYIPPAFSGRMATAVVTIGPIIFAYPFVQKYFVKGLTVGSIKG